MPDWKKLLEDAEKTSHRRLFPAALISALFTGIPTIAMALGLGILLRHHTLSLKILACTLSVEFNIVWIFGISDIFNSIYLRPWIVKPMADAVAEFNKTQNRADFIH